MYSSAFASELGNRIFVGVCSMIVRLIALARASLGLCVAAASTPFNFPDLQTILGELLEARVGQEAREFIGPADEASAVEERSHQMKEIQREGWTRHLVIEELRHVDAEEHRR
jgi:hypothetical protein